MDIDAVALEGWLRYRLPRAWWSPPCSSAPPSPIIGATSLGSVVRVAVAGSIIFAHPMAQRHHAAKKLAAAHRRIAEPLFARRHVGHDAAPGSDNRALADRHVVRKPDLSGQDDAILNDDAAGDAALRYDDAVAADPHIVSDLHQVVDLGAFANHGVAIGAAIDGGPGANLNIVLNDNPAYREALGVPRRSAHVAEAVLSDGAAGMHDHTIADQAIGD